MAERTCSDGYCNEPVAARGLCDAHYMQWWRDCERKNPRQLLGHRECAADGCPVIVTSRNKSGYCTKHNDKRPDRRKRHTETERLRRAARKAKDLETRPVCAYEGCTEPLQDNNKSGHCRKHHKRSPSREQWRREYYQRTDRPCAICGTGFARSSSAYCVDCCNTRAKRRSNNLRAAERERLFVAQEGLCPPREFGGCGLPMSADEELQVDHILPLARGGSNDDSNKQLMHRFCNQSKKDKLVPAALAIPPAVLTGRIPRQRPRRMTEVR